MNRPPREWTEHTFKCRRCHRKSRVARGVLYQAMDDLRAIGVEPDEQTTVTAFETCLSCFSGQEVAGEHIDAVASAR